MAFYWVNCGTYYNEIAENKFLWCPAYTPGGVVPVGWKIITEVKKGDVIFCHRHGDILSIAIALIVLAWFKSQGKGYQSRLNDILRTAMLDTAKQQ